MQQMKQSDEQWRDCQRENEKAAQTERRWKSSKQAEGRTHIRVVSSHEVSDDDRSIFKF